MTAEKVFNIILNAKWLCVSLAICGKNFVENEDQVSTMQAEILRGKFLVNHMI